MALGRQFRIAVDADRENAPQRILAGHAGQQAQRRTVGPVQVVEDDQHRSPRREPADHSHHRSEQGLSLGFEVRGRSRSRQAHAAGQLRQKPRKGRAVAPDDFGRVYVTELTHSRLQQPRPDPEGTHLIRFRATVEDGDVIPAGGQLRRQPGLSDSALAGQQGNPQFPARREVQFGPELVEDVLPPDQETALDAGVDLLPDHLRCHGRFGRRGGPGRGRGPGRGGRSLVGVQEALVDRGQLRSREGAELVAKQHPHFLVGPQRLGDIPLGFEQLDQRGPG